MKSKVKKGGWWWNRWRKCTCRFPEESERYGHETSCPRRLDQLRKP